MLRIRLRRMGLKKAPFYRLVVSDSRARPGGRFVDSLGTYDPKPDPPRLEIDVQRAEAWIRKGARPSDTVRSLLERSKTVGS